jgi:uncharacterized protein DUF997
MSSQTDPVVRSGRREALMVVGIWLTALTYSVITCYTLGYNRPVSELKLVFGFPEWVFWGVLVPWVTCSVVSWVFGAMFVRDGHLGQDLEETEDELGLGG